MIRPGVSVVVASAAAALITGCGRANPRLDELVRTQGDTTTTTRFSYEDNGQPSQVETDFGSGVSQAYTFTFGGGAVVKMKLTHRAGGGESVDESELDYDDKGRLSNVTTDIGDSAQTVVTTVDYDESGNVDKIVRKTAFGNGDNVQQTRFDYEDGVVARVTTTNTFEIEGQATTSSEQAIEATYKDGKVDEVTLSSPDNENGGTFSVAYEDGALAKLAFEGKDNGRAVSGKAAYDYEDGLMSGAVLSSDDSADVEFALAYGDGDASDVDMMPAELTDALRFWDLRGAPFGTVDVHTQAIRFAGASW